MPAPTIDELLIADDTERWAALGFALADGRCQIGRVRLRFLTGTAERGIVGWSLRDVAHTELDGLATTISEQPAPDPAATHPNGVVAIDHIVAMSPSLDRSVGALQDAGLDLRRIREQPTPAGAPRQAFFRLGTEILELIQEPYEVVERTGGRDRAGAVLGRRGPGGRSRPDGGAARLARRLDPAGAPSRSAHRNRAPLGGSRGCAGADERSRGGVAVAIPIYTPAGAAEPASTRERAARTAALSVATS